MRHNPHLYEINTLPYLRRLSKKYNRTLTLSTVPDEELQEIARWGFDLIWLMGVWHRSPLARRLALTEPSLIKEYSNILPDWTPEDIVGSPYAIFDYNLDPALGTATELSQLKDNLNRNGLGLILDFVPNHLAADHPWILSYPGRFIHGSREDQKAHPDWFFSPAPDIYVAHGRDPYFPPWSDTVQLNLFSPALRQALIRFLSKISEISDGVRCDMAMLVLNDIFEQVWGSILRSYPRPEQEFWTEAMAALHQKKADYLFLGEVYWSREKDLHRLGFDYTYDKNLYDRLLYAKTPDVLQQLNIDGLYQPKMARFIENHDEPRAITSFGKIKSLAATTAIMTLPGLRLINDGQIDGKNIKIPVQLAREPVEPVDIEVKKYYEKLLAIVNKSIFHDGKWQSLEIKSATDKPHQQVMSWIWQLGQDTVLVIINYAAKETQASLLSPKPLNQNGTVTDLLTRQSISYTSSENGVQFNLSPYQSLILSL